MIINSAVKRLSIEVVIIMAIENGISSTKQVTGAAATVTLRDEEVTIATVRCILIMNAL